MRLGLDLQGGTRLLLRAVVPDDFDGALDDALDGTITVLRRRVDGAGVAEAEITRQGSQDISVQLPGLSTEEARSLLGRTALLRFCQPASVAEGGGEPCDDTGQFVQTFGIVDGRPVALTGRFLRANSYVGTDAGGLPLVAFEWRGDGPQLSEQITEAPARAPAGDLPGRRAALHGDGAGGDPRARDDHRAGLPARAGARRPAQRRSAAARAQRAAGAERRRGARRRLREALGARRRDRARPGRALHGALLPAPRGAGLPRARRLHRPHPRRLQAHPGHAHARRARRLRALGRHGRRREHPDLRADEGGAPLGPRLHAGGRVRLPPRLALDPRLQRHDAHHLRHPLLARRRHRAAGGRRLQRAAGAGLRGHARDRGHHLDVQRDRRLEGAAPRRGGDPARAPPRLDRRRHAPAAAARVRPRRRAADALRAPRPRRPPPLALRRERRPGARLARAARHPPVAAAPASSSPRGRRRSCASTVRSSRRRSGRPTPSSVTTRRASSRPAGSSSWSARASSTSPTRPSSRRPRPSPPRISRARPRSSRWGAPSSARRGPRRAPPCSSAAPSRATSATSAAWSPSSPRGRRSRSSRSTPSAPRGIGLVWRVLAEGELGYVLSSDAHGFAAIEKPAAQEPEIDLGERGVIEGRARGALRELRRARVRHGLGGRLAGRRAQRDRGGRGGGALHHGLRRLRLLLDARPPALRRRRHHRARPRRRDRARRLLRSWGSSPAPRST